MLLKNHSFCATPRLRCLLSRSLHSSQPCAHLELRWPDALGNVILSRLSKALSFLPRASHYHSGCVPYCAFRESCLAVSLFRIASRFEMNFAQLKIDAKSPTPCVSVLAPQPLVGPPARHALNYYAKPNLE